MSDEKDVVPSAVDVSAIAHVRLPGFWRHSPSQWFIHADAVFASHRVTAHTIRVNHVLAALDEDGIRAVADLVGPLATYDALRNRLVDAFEVPRSMRFRTMLQPGGIGDRRPSQLLRDMRAILPEGIGEDALKEFWMQKLPAAVVTIVAGLDGPLDALAARADRVLEVSCPQNIDAMSDPRDRITELTARVDELTAEVGKLTTMMLRLLSKPATRQPRSATDSVPVHNSPPRTVRLPPCYYHGRYGEAARSCRAPCGFAPRQPGHDPPAPAEN